MTPREAVPGRTEAQSGAEVRRVSAREGYQLWAPTYDDDPNPLLALEERGLDPLLPNLKGKDVLDVGCGTGRWLRKLQNRGARSAVGVDLAAEMAVRAAVSPFLRGSLVLADCLFLPLRERVADVILCSFTLGHIADIHALGYELARVARQRADVFLTELHPDAQARGWRCGFRHATGPIEVQGFVYTRHDVECAFGCEGLSLQAVHDLRLGEPERLIFARAGKSGMFEAACRAPAVVVYRFAVR